MTGSMEGIVRIIRITSLTGSDKTKRQLKTGTKGNEYMADKGKDGKSSIVKRFDYMLTRKATQMNEPTITIVGNLSSNPEMRFTPNGVSVATFNVASNPRSKVDGEWVDGTTVFLSVTC